MVEHFDGIERVRRSNRRISTRRCVVATAHRITHCFRGNWTCSFESRTTKTLSSVSNSEHYGGLATAATAPRLHRGYQGFESLTFHERFRLSLQTGRNGSGSRDRLRCPRVDRNMRECWNWIDILALKAGAERRESSNLSSRTMLLWWKWIYTSVLEADAARIEGSYPSKSTTVGR